MIFRKNLSESLESYTARFGPHQTVDAIRPTWRLQGLRMLDPEIARMGWEQVVGRVLGPDTSPRIAPGLAIPTKAPHGYEAD